MKVLTCGSPLFIFPIPSKPGLYLVNSVFFTMSITIQLTQILVPVIKCEWEVATTLVTSSFSPEKHFISFKSSPTFTSLLESSNILFIQIPIPYLLYAVVLYKSSLAISFEENEIRIYFIRSITCNKQFEHQNTSNQDAVILHLLLSC